MLSCNCFEISTIWMGLRDWRWAATSLRLGRYGWGARLSWSCNRFEISTIWMGCETDVELQLLWDFDDMDGPARSMLSCNFFETWTIWVGCETVLELQPLWDFDDMGGVRDWRRAATASRLRRYKLAVRWTLSCNCFETLTIWMGFEADYQLHFLGRQRSILWDQRRVLSATIRDRRRASTATGRWRRGAAAADQQWYDLAASSGC